MSEPTTMDDKTTIRDYCANAAPEDTPMDDWTRGYEECKRRIHSMFQAHDNRARTAHETELRDVLTAVQAQFKLHGNSFPDGFDFRVCRWVDDVLAGTKPEECAVCDSKKAYVVEQVHCPDCGADMCPGGMHDRNILRMRAKL